METKYPVPNIGDKFGKLTVLSYYHIKEKGMWALDLQCECGNVLIKKRLGHLYGSKSKRPLKSCKTCGYISSSIKQRKYCDSQARLSVWSNYKVRAKQRSIKWDISKDDFFNIIILPCMYCGVEKTSYFNAPKESPWAKSFLYTGIDRVNSSKGYELTNIVPCCKICNRAKSDLTQEEFYKWIGRVYDKALSK